MAPHFKGAITKGTDRDLVQREKTVIDDLLCRLGERGSKQGDLTAYQHSPKLQSHEKSC
jgi:hypothetical protein